MMEKEAIKQLQENIDLPFGSTVTDEASELAIKALDAQTKLKEAIERINQPEYKNITWKKDEVVLLLQDLLAK